ncbi:MAG: carbamoyltransferase HypF [Methanobacteriota archaeon]|nr:MAG: carbamoyltransferase HypF [Euryarchaeota archaeon]
MRVTVYGVVQGVGFRPTVYRVARAMGLNGYVLNNGSNAEICVDRDVDEFLKRLRKALPSLARIDRVEIEEYDCGQQGFSIVGSREGRKESLIPTDTAICGNCVDDFERCTDKRHRYPFTNCTECGPRFTIITGVPFDRDRTSMSDFRMCESCLDEYEYPENRRFHAQVISCPECGPTYELRDHIGEVVAGEPFFEFARNIDDGRVGILKGWGGMHIVCALASSPRLRKIYRRGDKPYAIMTRDIEAAKRYAYVSEAEERVLRSPQRPIVLLKKKEEVMSALEGVAPGLDNVGIMLPYSAAHMLLFAHLEADAVIMTSANPPGEPMVVENSKAFELGLDCYLLHDRRIIHRCDDSVVKPRGDHLSFIRKSRGFVPLPLEANHDKTVIGVGAQWDVTGSITRNREIFLTQYIGESQQHPTLQYLGNAIRHLSGLLGTEHVDAISLDKHPRYSTRIMARQLAEEHGCQMVEVQHYHAHAASLMIDRRVFEPIVALAWDGTGYGDDGTSWGGETLLADFRKYKRLCTLQGLPLLGGDKAVLDPRRVVTALQLMIGLEPTLVRSEEVDIYSKMMGNSVKASSMGRVLDALSCILGFSCKRTYEGEPAIKLERWLEKGSVSNDFEVKFGVRNGIEYAETVPMFARILETRMDTNTQKADVAASFVCSLVSALAEKACEIAEKKGFSNVGLTGGVSYSNPISNWVERTISRNGLFFVTHERVPNGDGGISTGQNAIAGSLLG